MELTCAGILITDTQGLVPTGEPWLGVEELASRYPRERSREASLRWWRRLLARWESDGSCEVRRVAGRVGRPRLQVLASDFERWAGLDGALAA